MGLGYPSDLQEGAENRSMNMKQTTNPFKEKDVLVVCVICSCFNRISEWKIVTGCILRLGLRCCVGCLTASAFWLPSQQFNVFGNDFCGISSNAVFFPFSGADFP